MFTRYAILLGLYFVFISVSWAEALSIAVFPVEDLSQGKNSVNSELTDYLAQNFVAQDFDVVPPSKVLSFMTRKRVRWLGYLDTEHVLLAGKELEADFLLFGTICQRRENVSPTLGLTLFLVRAQDARTIWSGSGGLGTEDVQHILGLDEPSTTEDLMPLLLSRVLAGWPKNLDVGGAPLSADGIDSVSLEPRYMRPGEKVKCTVRLRAIDIKDSRPSVYIKAGNRVYLAEESSDGQYYEAAWTGSDSKPEKRSSQGRDFNFAALHNNDYRMFESVWPGQEKDDRYPVSLVLSWPTGRQKTVFIGAYVVDGSAPQVTLGLKGPAFNGATTFRRQVVITPRIMEREPFSHWLISVENEAGKELVSEKGKGNIPHRFTWKGYDSNGLRVEDGRYTVLVKVWDRAGNMGFASQKVAYRRSPPSANLETRKLGKQMTVDIKYKGEVPLAYWYLEMWSDEMNLLKTVEGETLPARVTLPFESWSAHGNVGGWLVLKDVLGNQTKQEIKDLFRVAMKEKTTETKEKAVEPMAWNTEF